MKIFYISSSIQFGHKLGCTTWMHQGCVCHRPCVSAFSCGLCRFQQRGAHVVSAAWPTASLPPAAFHGPCAWPSYPGCWPNEHVPRTASPSRPHPCQSGRDEPAWCAGWDQSHPDAIDVGHRALPARRRLPVLGQAASRSARGTGLPCVQ